LAPALLLLHGTSGDESSLLSLGRAIAPGAALLSPRGKVEEHGMARFFRRLGEAFDEEDLQFRTAELAGFVRDASAAYRLRADRLVAVGFSNGGNIAASLVLRCPATLAGAIIMRGGGPFVLAKPMNLERKPVLMLSGLDDPIVGTDEAGELANIFRAANVELTLHWEKAGHILVRGDILMAFDWLRRFYETRQSPRPQ